MSVYPMQPNVARAEESRNVRGVKLEGSEIKPSDGEFSEYKNFRRTFGKLHANYEDGEKLEYLRGKLIGGGFSIRGNSILR